MSRAPARSKLADRRDRGRRRPRHAGSQPWALELEPQWHGQRANLRKACRGDIAFELEALRACQELLYGYAQLQAAERSAGAIVRPSAKCQVVVEVRPVQAECRPLGEYRFVAVCGGIDECNRLARRDLASAELHFAHRRSGEAAVRRVEPQELFHGRRNQLWVSPQLKTGSATSELQSQSN